MGAAQEYVLQGGVANALLILIQKEGEGGRVYLAPLALMEKWKHIIVLKVMVGIAREGQVMTQAAYPALQVHTVKMEVIQLYAQ